MSLVIDYGSKTDDIYEFYPRSKIEGKCIVSFDVGKGHYGVWVEDLSKNKCLYAGLWKIGESMTLETQMRLTSLLDKLKNFYAHCDTVIVERQVGININMIIQLEQHTLSYFELKYPFITVNRIHPKTKYKKMDGPSGEKSNVRKAWAITKAVEILTERKELIVVHFLNTLNSLRNDKERKLKADDVSDAFIQLLASRV